MDQTLKAKETSLVECLQALDSVVVAYSGGVDSSLLAYYARLVLSKRATIVIAISPSLAESELNFARQQAANFGWDLLEIFTDEVEKEEYLRNDPLRCYVCKSTLFSALDNIAHQRGYKYVCYGANMDDLQDFRPGHKAAVEHKVISPLREAQLTKEEIRSLAFKVGLPSWDRPQAACLSSRFPTYQPVTKEHLSQVETAEAYLHSLGFRQVRVRHHGDIARIELDEADLCQINLEPKLMQQIASQIAKLGYRWVTLDLAGYRQGSSNLSAKHHNAVSHLATHQGNDQ